MLVEVVADALMGTNCWVLAPAAGEECLVVDPGFDVVDRLEQVLLARRLRPAAVLLTHGHADHVWSVTPVCRRSSPASAAATSVLPALIHGDDAHRLRDPLASLSAPLLAMLEDHFGPAPRWAEPDDVRHVTDGDVLSIAGLSLRVQHAPGHTEGSTVFTLDVVPAAQADAGLTSTLLAGDVLFAGSIGRTDLPGGDAAAMATTLRDVVVPMPDDRLVLPGHGGATTIGRERASNPYLPR